MKASLQDQIVVVIGGTAGMGRAIAEAAQAAGGGVTIASRSREKVERVAREIGIEGRMVDITVESSVENLFREIGEIDHLVISASSVSAGPIRELPTSSVEATFRSKFFGPYLCAKYASIRKTGSITLFSGILSRRPGRNDVALAAVNAAVEAMGRALALEFAPVRVNTISPGLTRGTDAFSAMPEEGREEMFTAVGSRLPTGRVGQPEDIASAALMLMTNGFATGITLDVDGGGLLL